MQILSHKRWQVRCINHHYPYCGAANITKNSSGLRFAPPLNLALGATKSRHSSYINPLSFDDQGFFLSKCDCFRSLVLVDEVSPVNICHWVQAFIMAILVMRLQQIRNIWSIGRQSASMSEFFG